MSGLKGLKKGERTEVEERAEAFIAGTAARVSEHRARRPRNFQRYTFSLTPDVSEEMDKLSLVPRTFRASRSDVVKAGVLALQRMPEADLLTLLAEVTQDT